MMKNKNFFDAIGCAGVIGLHLVSGIIVGLILGYLFDSQFETSPWGLLIFLVIGIIAGFRNMWSDAKTLMRISADRNKASNTPKKDIM